MALIAQRRYAELPRWKRAQPEQPLQQLVRLPGPWKQTVSQPAPVLRMRRVPPSMARGHRD